MNSKRPVIILSIIGVLLVTIMLTLFQHHEKVDRYIARQDEDYCVWTDYEYSTYHDDNAPLGIVQEYTWTITDTPGRNSCIAFYLVHQYAEIYVGNELLFQLFSNEDNLLTNTIGCDWAKAYLRDTDVNQKVRILIYPVYKTSIDKIPTIYYGNHNSIASEVIESNIIIIALGIIAIIIGLAFILFVIVNIKNRELDKSIAALGAFSIFTGSWKIADTEAIPFLFDYATLLFSGIALISITLMLVAFIIFIRNQFSKRVYFYWNCVCIVGLIFCITICLLQLFGIADLRQTLSACHILIVIDILCIIITLIWEAAHHRLSAKLKMTSLCFILCSVGAAIDLLLYYISGASGNMMLCMLAFLFYVILMGYMAVKEALVLIQRGKEAKRYQHLAIHDQMTGLYNRVFWAEYIQEHKFDEKDCFIIMLDVNNLKQCNDTLGHDAGDRLLINSANLINESFHPNGIPFRMGGDEFCVILNVTSENICRSQLRRFLASVEQFNKKYADEYPVQIAYGYARYNPKTDFDFGDTLRRADKYMYQKKLEMKKA
ncbi:MAG: GGDEF domain-containing protein [Lachnospiraceae bacterium]|nr:GGDEF domain-containing protein [Lachnospiraceae bacterium]